MAMLTTCRCGQQLRIPADAERVRCPSCSAVLRIKSRGTKPQKGGGQASQRLRSTAAVQMRCPCGSLVSLPSNARSATCGQCGTLIRPRTKASLRDTSAAGSVLPSTLELGDLPGSTDFARYRSTQSKAPAAVMPNSRARLDRKEQRTSVVPRWLASLSITAAALSLVAGGGGWLLFRFAAPHDPPAVSGESLDESVAEERSASEGEPELIRIATYPPGPRLPGTIEFLPRAFVESLPAELDEFFRIVPPEENAAPHYLEALAQIEGGLEICFPPERRAAIRQLAERNSAQITEWSLRLENGDPLPSIGELASFDPVIEAVMAAQQRPQCSFLLGYQLSDRLPYLQAARNLVRLMEVRRETLGDSQAIDQAIAEYQMLVRLCRDVAPDGSVGQMIATAIETIAHRKLLPSLVVHREFSGQQARSLIRILREHDAKAGMPAYIRSVRKEQLMFLNMIAQLQRDPDFIDEFLAAISIEQPTEKQIDVAKLLKSAVANMTPSHFKENKRVYGVIVSGQLDLLRSNEEDLWSLGARLRTQFEQAINMDQAGKDTKQLLLEGRANELPWLVGVIAPSADLGHSSYVECIAWRQAAVGLLAIELWNRDHDSSPENIEALFAHAGLASVPTDPFGGQAMRFVTRPEGFAVYSIGGDLRDDHARTLAEGWNEAGDIYLSVP